MAILHTILDDLQVRNVVGGARACPPHGCGAGMSPAIARQCYTAAAGSAHLIAAASYDLVLQQFCYLLLLRVAGAITAFSIISVIQSIVQSDLPRYAGESIRRRGRLRHSATSHDPAGRGCNVFLECNIFCDFAI